MPDPIIHKPHESSGRLPESMGSVLQQIACEKGFEVVSQEFYQDGDEDVLRIHLTLDALPFQLYLLAGKIEWGDSGALAESVDVSIEVPLVACELRKNESELSVLSQRVKAAEAIKLELENRLNVKDLSVDVLHDPDSFVAALTALAIDLPRPENEEWLSHSVLRERIGERLSMVADILRRAGA